MAAQSLAAAAASDHKNRNLIIFAAAIFVRLPSLPFAVAIKNFYLICSSFQVLCSAAIASAASCSVPFFIFPVLISYNSLRFSLVAPAQILHGHLLFCWTVAG